MGGEGRTSVAFFVSVRQLNWKRGLIERYDLPAGGSGGGFGGNGSGGGAGAGGVGGDGFLGIRISIRESLLLQWFGVNLVDANNAADKIPVLLVRKSAIARRPGEIARRLWMIGIVHKIAVLSRIRG